MTADDKPPSTSILSLRRGADPQRPPLPPERSGRRRQPSPTPPAPPAFIPGGLADYFILDFKALGLDALHAKIIKRAAKNFRTPQNEILYLLDQALRQAGTD